MSRQPLTRSDLSFLLFQLSVEMQKEDLEGKLTIWAVAQIALRLRIKLLDRWALQTQQEEEEAAPL